MNENKKQYMKEYREINKNKLKEYSKKYRLKNKSIIKKKQEEYYKKHIDKNRLKNKIWASKNKSKIPLYRIKYKDKISKYNKKYLKENYNKIITQRINNPEYQVKSFARHYARNHKQRSLFCETCGIEENLEFHHTNYELNQGITLCRKCHKGLHFGGSQ